MKHYIDLPTDDNIIDTLNDLSTQIFKDNVLKGFYDIPYTCPNCKNQHQQERNIIEAIMLIVTELSEAVETLRKEPDRVDDHIPQHQNFHVEIADAMIRLLDLAAYQSIPIGQVIIDKLVYNRTREHKHGKNC